MLPQSYYTVSGDKELIRYLEKSISDIKPQIISGLKEAAKLVEKESKNKLGTYQRTWPKLRQNTVMSKYYRRAKLNGVNRPKLGAALGLINRGVADDPLVLSGKLRESINHEILEASLEAIIFSDEKHAAVHEFGHRNVPARSYLRLTLWDEEDEIGKIIDKKVGGIF